MSDQRVIDAYLGAHHDQVLTFEEEQRIHAEAQTEVDSAVRGSGTTQEEQA